MIGFTIRNLKVFFKDKTSVFFSLLSVFIIIGLYAFFLGDVWVESLEAEGITNARYLMDSWIMAGLLAVSSFTTTMGAFGTMVDDKTKKISKDFISSPLKRTSIAGGYVLSSFIIGVIMCLITLVLAEVYVLSNGGELMNFITLIKTLGLIILATFTNTSIILFLVSLFKSANAFATASTIVGTLIGFVTGIYLPIGNLPATIQWIIKLFPVSHAAALMRQTMMADAMNLSLAGAPTEVIADFENTMGVTFKFGSSTATPIISIIVLIATAAVFYILAVISLSKKNNGR